MKKFFMIFFILFKITLLYAVEVIDDVGRKIFIKKPLNKIISLSPAHTEMIYFLNKQEKLIAVTYNCDYPEDAKNKEKVGTFLKPDIEKIIKLNPDLIISGGGIQKSIIRKLEKLNFSIIVLYPRNIVEIINNLKLLAKIFDAEMEKINGLEKKLIKLKTKKSIKTYFELWDKPRMGIGGKSFVNDIIEYAGGENIFKNALSEYPKVSDEEILKNDPELIIFLYDKKLDDKLFEQTTAGKKNNIIVLSKDYQDLFLRPGPRIAFAIEYLHKIYKEILKNEK